MLFHQVFTIIIKVFFIVLGYFIVQSDRIDKKYKKIKINISLLKRKKTVFFSSGILKNSTVRSNQI